ncbi:hypothetical protein ACIBM3_32985 [Rhodococcus erythropolis]|uniref:hypothetical protein n=1 Tax=Rhodococcus erythropolis TaxID=1833 RepID=UPI0037A65E95
MNRLKVLGQPIAWADARPGDEPMEAAMTGAVISTQAWPWMVERRNGLSDMRGLSPTNLKYTRKIASVWGAMQSANKLLANCLGACVGIARQTG